MARDNWQFVVTVEYSIEGYGSGSQQTMEETRVQSRAESPTGKGSLYVCCSKVIL
jgi:hypothetical protein